MRTPGRGAGSIHKEGLPSVTMLGTWLEFPVSRTKRNKLLLFISYLVCGSSLNGLRHLHNILPFPGLQQPQAVRTNSPQSLGAWEGGQTLPRGTAAGARHVMWDLRRSQDDTLRNSIHVTFWKPKLREQKSSLVIRVWWWRRGWQRSTRAHFGVITTFCILTTVMVICLYTFVKILELLTLKVCTSLTITKHIKNFKGVSYTVNLCDFVKKRDGKSKVGETACVQIPLPSLAN